MACKDNWYSCKILKYTDVLGCTWDNVYLFVLTHCEACWHICLSKFRSLVQRMAWRPFGVKPLVELILNYCQFDPRKKFKDSCFETKKDHNWQAPMRFSEQIGISNIETKYDVFVSFCRKLYYIFECRFPKQRYYQNFKMLVVNFLDLGFSSENVLVTCPFVWSRCNYSWIHISPVDQTRFNLTRTVLLCNSMYRCMAIVTEGLFTKRLCSCVNLHVLCLWSWLFCIVWNLLCD